MCDKSLDIIPTGCPDITSYRRVIGTRWSTWKSVLCTYLQHKSCLLLPLLDILRRRFSHGQQLPSPRSHGQDAPPPALQPDGVGVSPLRLHRRLKQSVEVPDENRNRSAPIEGATDLRERADEPANGARFIAYLYVHNVCNAPRQYVFGVWFRVEKGVRCR